MKHFLWKRKYSLYKSKGNYTIDINPNNIIDARYFSREFVRQIGTFDHRNICFMLVSGREREQREVILHHLRLKGYRIDSAIFINIYNAHFPDSVQYFDDSSFLIYYRYWKAQIINELRLSNEYKSITVIDNDDSIFIMLRQLGLNVIKANIKSFRDNLHIIFSDFNPVQKLEIKNW